MVIITVFGIGIAAFFSNQSNMVTSGKRDASSSPNASPIFEIEKLDLALFHMNFSKTDLCRGTMALAIRNRHNFTLHVETVKATATLVEYSSGEVERNVALPGNSQLQEIHPQEEAFVYIVSYDPKGFGFKDKIKRMLISVQVKLSESEHITQATLGGTFDPQAFREC